MVRWAKVGAMILGLDIGGANTKGASSDAKLAKSTYLPLWKGAPLPMVLGSYAAQKPDAVAVVITGELADCFSCKVEGINSIMADVKNAFSCPVHFWGVNGFSWKDPIELAGANWSASAALICRDVGDCLFVDLGSTTTDLIPIKGRPMASKTDFLRLARGELVYMGKLRTRLDAVLPVAYVSEDNVPLSPELFATIADAYLALGQISEDQYTCDTADGADKSRGSTLRRLARSVCADLKEIGEAGALAIAEQARDRQMRVLVAAIERQASEYGLSKVTAAGIGETLIAKAASFLGLECIQLSEMYGLKISEVFPAYAAAKMLESSMDLKDF
jgi:(4-(4-[2-(gamma-L-glutamylamino)ethyl]phenoxymethyl)furan-2-yl)methanamine synthase